ncbi:MAG TPA: hypothetical protein VGC89_06365 [Pyrinomonadaceae bacterium]|jgi:hypothetical protein
MKTTQARTGKLLNLFAVFVSCFIAAHLTGQISVVEAQVPIPMPRLGGSGKVDISKAGPSFAASYLLSRITATVLVRRAPMVVEYQLGKGSAAKLTLAGKINGKEQTFTQNLNPTGNEIGEMKFMLPEEFGDKARVATLSVIAENVDPNNKEPPDFALYGLGMGERAVGSLFIVGLGFQPDRFNSKQEKTVNYSFRSRAEFEKAYVKIQIMGVSNGRPARQDVDADSITRAIHRDETVVGSWNGKNKKGKISTGRHQLFVSAWFGANKGGDWTSAWSRQRLVVE